MFKPASGIGLVTNTIGLIFFDKYCLLSYRYIICSFVGMIYPNIDVCSAVGAKDYGLSNYDQLFNL